MWYSAKRRRVMSHAFTPKAIGKLEQGIRRRAAAMIDGLLAKGNGDWIEDVADVLPMSVIGDRRGETVISVVAPSLADVVLTMDFSMWNRLSR